MLLFVSSVSPQHDKLDWDASLRILKERLSGVGSVLSAVEVDSSEFKLTLSPGTRVKDVQIPPKVHIFQFFGHGSNQGLWLRAVEDCRDPTLIVPDDVGAVFANRKVMCALFLACWSDAVGSAVAPHVDLVIGLSESINLKTAANPFLEAFYSSLSGRQGPLLPALISGLKSAVIVLTKKGCKSELVTVYWKGKKTDVEKL